MIPFADMESTHAALRRLVRMRWLLLLGALLAILAAPALLAIPLPMPPLMLVLALAGAFNALTASRVRRGDVVTSLGLGIQAVVDLGVLGVLLFLTGGAANPLVSLLLLPVAAAALTLPWQWACGIAAGAIGLYSFLAVWFVPLRVADPQRAASLHLAGMWLTFVVSVILIAWLIVRMTASIRARDAALAQAREQALRGERVVALGALAAGAAHELGTPLATMAVIAGELEHEPGLSAEAKADLDLLRRQIGLCKNIVTGLADRAGAARLEGARAVAADRWLADVVDHWRTTRPHAACALNVRGGSPAPAIVVDTTVEQALVNLLDNAANAAKDNVEILLDWDRQTLAIEIRDDGPGFSDDLLIQAGRSPVASTTGGSGIGLLLASAAVGRLGGRLALANRHGGGADARVTLPLAGALATGEAA